MHAEPGPPTRRPPLEGIVVADFSRVLAGPLAAMVLGDLGAEVIKVERPEGDDTRAWGPPWAADGTSTYFESVNRNKRSVVLDLREAGDLELARRLIAARRRADRELPARGDGAVRPRRGGDCGRRTRAWCRAA